MPPKFWKLGESLLTRLVRSNRVETSTGKPQETLNEFSYRPRWYYMFPFRTKRLNDFLFATEDTAVSVAYTYYEKTNDITVTLIPLRHFAHPLFFQQVDALCSQHQSVLMEGRSPIKGAPYSTIVPPREMPTAVRPPEHEDDEGWEPRGIEGFWQPFSWGVKDSSNFTVVHAADKYDYEKLPWWSSLRFNLPLIGSFSREKHCLNMIYPLRANGYKSFAIPWGAGHMPVFNEILLDNNFEQISMCSLLIFNRVDGEVSAGEHEKIWRFQKRQERISGITIGFTVVAILLLLRNLVTVEYTKNME